MIHAYEPAIMAHANVLEQTTKNRTKNGNRKSAWHRFSVRLSEITRGKTKNPKRGKFGTLLRMADDERKIVSLSRQYSQNVQNHHTEEKIASLSSEIQLLQQRLSALEKLFQSSERQSLTMAHKMEKIDCQVQMLVDQKLPVPPVDGVHCTDTQTSWKRVLNRCVEQIRIRDYNLHHVVENLKHCDAKNAGFEIRQKCAGCGTFDFQKC